MINQITFTRFLAAMAIVVYHYGTGIFPFSVPALNFLMTQANVGVSYFFILSGFIMVVAYGNKNHISATEYMKNRVARIYPLVVLSVLPYFAIAIKAERVSFTDVLLNFTNLQAWIPGKATAGNYPLWSVSVEFFFYLCFPYLYNFIYSKKSLTGIIIGAIALLVVAVGVQHYLLYTDSTTAYMSKEAVFDFIYYFPLLHLPQFIIGNAAGFFYRKYSGGKRNYDVPVLMMAILFIVALKYPVLNYHNGVLAIVFVPFIYFLAANTGYITQILSNRYLVFLGEISFAIYVLQAPVFTVVKLACQILLHTTDSDALNFWIAITALLIASAFAHIYVEKPMRNRIRTILFKEP